MKSKQFKYNFTFNNDLMMNRKLSLCRFNVSSEIKNDFGHKRISWRVTLLIKVSL